MDKSIAKMTKPELAAYARLLEQRVAYLTDDQKKYFRSGEDTPSMTADEALQYFWSLDRR